MTKPISRNRQDAIYWRFEFKLPVSTVGLQAKEPDMGDVHSMLAVDSNEPKGLEQQGHLADRPDIDERRARPQANFGLPSLRVERVHVVRIEHAMLGAGNVNENSVRHDDCVVARLGLRAHTLAIQSMGRCPVYRVMIRLSRFKLCYLRPLEAPVCEYSVSF